MWGLSIDQIKNSSRAKHLQRAGNVQITLLCPEFFLCVLSHFEFSDRKKIENSEIVIKQNKTKVLKPAWNFEKHSLKKYL